MKNNSRAFTLIETLIAITIITIAIVGPMTAASRAIVAAQTARDQLTASYLAQEGVEYVRAVRDDTYLAAYYSSSHDTSSAWSDFTTSGVLSDCVSELCVLGSLTHAESVITNALIPCTGSQCSGAPITLGGTGMEFTRTIQLAVSATDASVTSQVSWDFHGTPHTVTVTNHLTPWQ